MGSNPPPPGRKIFSAVGFEPPDLVIFPSHSRIIFYLPFFLQKINFTKKSQKQKNFRVLRFRPAILNPPIVKESTEYSGFNKPPSPGMLV